MTGMNAAVVVTSFFLVGLLVQTASAQLVERSEGATSRHAIGRGTCELHRGGEIRCTDGRRIQQRFVFPDATSIELLDDSLYWLERSGDVRMILRWQDRVAPVTLLTAEAHSANARLEGGGTSPPSTIFDYNPHHLICIRESDVRCWGHRPGWASVAGSAAALWEVPMPPTPRRVLVGPPLVVQRANGTIAVLDQNLRGWLEFADGRFRNPRQPLPASIQLTSADRNYFRVRLNATNEARCMILGERVLCQLVESE